MYLFAGVEFPILVDVFVSQTSVHLPHIVDRTVTDVLYTYQARKNRLLPALIAMHMYFHVATCIYIVQVHVYILPALIVCANGIAGVLNKRNSMYMYMYMLMRDVEGEKTDYSRL